MPDTQSQAFTPTTLRTPLAPGEAVARLLKLSRKGKLAGFEKRTDTEFRVSVFGTLYDCQMIGRAQPADDGSTIILTTSLLKKLPVTIIVVFALATWPGVILTESLLESYFPGSLVARYTWWWYIPLMLVTVPALIKQYKGSMRAAYEHEQEVIEKIRAALDASPAQ